jgi:alkylation response protein AidB-like acyl-CoA dehydrogenase
VFFTDVRVPGENLVGEENEGWTIAKYLLSHERTNIAGIGFSIAAFEQVLEMARTPGPDGRRPIDDPLFAARLARVEIDLEALKITNLRMLDRACNAPARRAGKLDAQDQGHGDPPGAERSRPPRCWAPPRRPSRPRRPTAMPVSCRPRGGAGRGYFNNRKISIFGGSNEIQRNILAK